MALPDISMRQLLEAGVHFGHQKHRWNPKMATFIYGVRNNIHIIDLAQTVPLLYRALQAVSDTVAAGGRVLFVGTKRQASEPITSAAQRSAQYYVNARWLGGMLTNWKTMSKSIKRLREVEEILTGDPQGLTKKELLTLTRERNRLERDLGGIKDMGGVPDLLFVIDTNKEAIAIQEANRLGIPVAAIVDSNCDPDKIALPIPGNDDAGRAITLYCDLVAKAAIDGISRGAADAGVDTGADETVAAQAEVDAAAAETETADAGAATPATEADAAVPAKDADAAMPATEADAAKDAEAAVPAVDGEAATTQPAELEKTADDVDMSSAEAVEPQARDSSAGDGDGEKSAAAEVLFEKPSGDPDDLKKITGVGQVLEKKLLELGVQRFDQIAALSDEDVERIDAALNFKGRIQRDDWIGQAKKLAGGE